MSNILKVPMQTTINALYSLGRSIRQIARELGLNRRTVRRYVGAALRARSPDGPEGTVPDSEVASGSVGLDKPKCTTPDLKVAAGSRSRCEPWRTTIEALVAEGLSAERIWQDLRAGHGFAGAYNSVKRFVAALPCSSGSPKQVHRIECEPGQEMQIDFMQGPLLPDPDKPGKRRRCWILCAVLSCSRKSYSEAVWRQDTESFLRVVENALRAFGGVPTLLNLDNLRAAVQRADWFDPQLCPKFADFCRHYGITPMPCRPRTPQHKGKVERNVHYVRHNALAGHEFTSLGGVNTHLRQWEASVADTRTHGTTRRQVGEHFTTVEKPALKPLPMELFAAYTEARRIVGRDGYVEVAKAYYQAPPEHIGRSVWVRFDVRQVRIFDLKMVQIASHTRLEPGRYSSVRGVRGLDQAGTLQSTICYWQSRAGAIGPAAARWAQRATNERGAEAVRSLMGLCALLKKHGASRVEQACHQALEYSGSSNPTLSTIRSHLDSQPKQNNQPPQPPNPLIRELFIYGQFIQNQTNDTTSNNNNNTPDTSNTPRTTNAIPGKSENSHEPPHHLEKTSQQTASQHPGHQS
jgi:transposase